MAHPSSNASPIPSPTLVEDGGELTRQAWDLLTAEGKDLGLPNLHVQCLPDFLQIAHQHRTSTSDRQAILDQATLIFDHLYPHMPFKTEIYHFTHPSDFLRQEIQPKVDSLSEIDFHAQVITAFSLVRDAHTLYGLPSPFRGATAFLPFQMRPFLDSKAGWRFIVTSVMDTQPGGGFGHPYFGVGAEIVGWVDLGVLAQVERTESHLPGGNFFAGLMRGAIHSTLRPLTFVQLPFADELPAATIQYRPFGAGEIQAIRLPWGVGTGLGAAGGFPTSVFSLSPATAITTACGKLLHHRGQMREDRKAAETQDPAQVSNIPEIFQFQYTSGPLKKGCIDVADLADHERPDARFGYIRIKAFSDGASGPGSTDRIVEEFQRIVTLLDQAAPDGLIIDIRDNPGGDVQAAERMLQMLTARPITPIRFHLANTPAVQNILRKLKTSLNSPLDAGLTAADQVKLSNALAELQAWLDDAEEVPLPQGSRLTSGRPLTDPESANAIGQIYQGRGVALLVNSLTYSAADIFAAGFQDHGVGKILGTSLVTGGGGANVWSHGDIINKIGPNPGIPLAALPGDASMSLAIRRCSRVGRFAGQPVEDQGVTVDVSYLTDNVEDLVAGNPGLLRRACQEMRDRDQFRVDAGPAVLREDGSVTVDVRTTNIESLKFILIGNSSLHGHLALSISARGGSQTVTVPANSRVPAPSALRIEGYSPDSQAETGSYADRSGGLQLVRARTVPLQAPLAPVEFDPVLQSITGTDSDSGTP